MTLALKWLLQWNKCSLYLIIFQPSCCKTATWRKREWIPCYFWVKTAIMWLCSTRSTILISSNVTIKHVVPDKTDSPDNSLCSLHCSRHIVYKSDPIQDVVVEKFLEFIITAHECLPFRRRYVGVVVDVWVPKDAWLDSAGLLAFVAVLRQPAKTVLRDLATRP